METELSQMFVLGGRARLQSPRECQDSRGRAALQRRVSGPEKNKGLKPCHTSIRTIRAFSRPGCPPGAAQQLLFASMMIRSMKHSGLIPTAVLILLSSCLGQVRGGTEPTVAVPILKQVLARANVSGSLAYWGRCDFHKPYPDFPALTCTTDSSRPPAKVLQEIFAPDPKMEVTQDPNGVVRMFETDVPTDLLDVTISHVSFALSDQQRDTFGGPNNAMFLVLSAPEVIAYRKEHNIGPLTELRYAPGDSASKQEVTGDLYNVTVKQAFDYILQFYPGFWLYENCQTDDATAGRNVFLGYYRKDIPHN